MCLPHPQLNGSFYSGTAATTNEAANRNGAAIINGAAAGQRHSLFIALIISTYKELQLMKKPVQLSLA